MGLLVRPPCRKQRQPRRLPHESPRGARARRCPGDAVDTTSERPSSAPRGGSADVAIRFELPSRASPPRGLLLAPRYDVAPRTHAHGARSRRWRRELRAREARPARTRETHAGRVARRREDAPLARHRRDPRRRSSASSSARTTRPASARPRQLRENDDPQEAQQEDMSVISCPPKASTSSPSWAARLNAACKSRTTAARSRSDRTGGTTSTRSDARWFAEIDARDHQSMEETSMELGQLVDEAKLATFRSSCTATRATDERDGAVRDRGVRGAGACKGR